MTFGAAGGLPALQEKLRITLKNKKKFRELKFDAPNNRPCDILDKE